MGGAHPPGDSCRSWTRQRSRRGCGSDLATWEPPEFDAPAFDGGTWLWLNYLRGKLRHGGAWMVRYGVMDTLNNRVLPLLGTAGHSAHQSLDAADIDRVHRAAPTSAEPAELRRSLRATAELYAWALDRWSQRTGQPVPRSPLAPVIMDKLQAATRPTSPNRPLTS